MIKAIFFDIDGTLVSFKTHRIPDSTRQSLIRLRQKNIRVFISTGRRMQSIDNLGDLEFDGYATANGSFCFIGKDRPIHRVFVPKEDVENLLDRFVDAFPFAVVQEDQIYINFIDDRVRDIFELLRFPPPMVTDLRQVLDREIIQLLVFVPPSEEVAALAVMPHCKPARWNPVFCDVIPRESGKGIGVLKVLDHFGISSQESMAFGDGGNDIEMLETVGIGVAMGNAGSEVKQVADYVTTSVDNNGIYKALRHFNLLE